MRNKLWRIILLALLMVLSCASAEDLPEGAWALVPAGAVLEDSGISGNAQVFTLFLPETGERMQLRWDAAAGRALSLETEQPAPADAQAEIVDRARAEEIIRAQYPDCRILFSADTEAGKRLGVAAEFFCGTIVVSGDRICARSLRAGEIFRGDRLTEEGALQVLILHRPDAQFGAVELELDDGIWVYEGEALLDGEEYEFELDASTGRLLEWERD